MEAAEYDRMANVEERHWWFRARLAVVRTFLKRYVPPGVGLDCSCGTGMTLKSLPQWVQIGADLNGSALKHSRARGLSRLLQGDLRKLPFANDSLDVVTSLDTLEHIEEDEQALAEIHRVLKPGGYGLFTVPAHPWMFGPHDRALHHVRRYRRGEFRQKVSTAGFHIRKYRYINTALFPLVAGVRLVSRGGGEARSDTEKLPAGPLNFALYAAFASERLLLPWLPSPWGISLLCLARKLLR
ncbi:MAG: methyltransferase domain-containing protein [Planctomycetes bacterium]|nr:methyltransferase domain-containing protein [Planctomycetota bacterium]